MDLTALLGAADRAVDAAAAWLAAADSASFRRGAKASGEEVTPADLAVHAVVAEALAGLTPDIPMVGEETPGGAELLPRCWLLDPIDGTMNVARGAPYHAVSLALLDACEPVVGVVYAPALRARASATLPAGLRAGRTLPGGPRDAGPGPALPDAIVGLTGGGGAHAPEVAGLVATMFRRAHRIRMHGSMCLDLYGTAFGWIDACVCVGPHAWDVAAGIVLARANGRVVLGPGGADLSWADLGWNAPFLVAGRPELAVQVLEIVEEALG